MSTLGSLLVQNRIVGVVQIEKALQRQVIYGGDLATNLLELSVADEDDIARYAGCAFGMPVLERLSLANLDERLVRMIPWEKANEHRFVPVGLDHDKMVVAVSSPIPENALEEVAFLLGVEFVPHFVLEFRLALALNRCYGIPLSKRMLKLKKRLAPDTEIDLPPILPPPEMRHGLLTGIDPRQDADVSEVPSLVTISDGDALDEGNESGVGVIEEAGGTYTDRVSIPEEKGGFLASATAAELEPIEGAIPDIEAARSRLDQTRQRDEVIDIFLQTVSSVFEYAVLFVIQGNQAKAHSRATETDGVSRIGGPTLRVDEGGMFETAFKTASFYLGAPGKTASDNDALQKMNRERPKNCAILPVVLRERVILLLYGDSGSLGVKSEHISELTRLTQLVSQTFDRILMEKKYGQYRNVGSRLPSRPAHSAFSQVPSMTGSDISQSIGEYRTAGVDESGKMRAKISVAISVNDSRTSVIPKAPPDAGWDEVAESVDQAISGNVGKEAPSGSFVDPPSEPINLYEPPKKADPKKTVAAAAAVIEEAPQEPTKKPEAAPVDAVNRSVMVNMSEEVDRLVERLLTSSSFDSTALELLLGIGEDAIKKLVVHFPGPLHYDRYQQEEKLRRVGSHGPLLKALIAFGKEAIPHLLPLLESRESDVRFYATFLFSEMKYPEVLDSLVLRLFDKDRQIRAIAIDVIRGFEAFSEYRWALKSVVNVLDDPAEDMERKQIAAGALGELGEPSAVGKLIELLNAADGKLLQISHRALVKICFLDFGYSEKIWSIWYSENRDRSRIEWAIDGLTGADESIRRASLRSLEKMAGDALAITEPPTNMLQLKELQQRLQSWWERTGRDLHHRLGGD